MRSARFVGDAPLTTVAEAAPDWKRKVWLWPNVLSLDAPALAIVWQLLFIKCVGAHFFEPSLFALLGATCWVIYAGDRILDGFQNPILPGETPRHQFYRLNRRAIVPFIVLVSIATLWASIVYIPPLLLDKCLLLGSAVSLYLILVHVAPKRLQSYWPKELIVAALFAISVSLPAWTDISNHQVKILVPVLALTSLLWINAVAIECWEQALDLSEAHLQARPRITQLLGAHLALVAFIIAIACLLVAFSPGSPASARPLYIAISASAILIGGLDSVRGDLSRDALRVLADATLLTPIFYMRFVIK
jgi:hypothetical protein